MTGKDSVGGSLTDLKFELAHEQMLRIQCALQDVNVSCQLSMMKLANLLAQAIGTGDSTLNSVPASTTILHHRSLLAIQDLHHRLRGVNDVLQNSLTEDRQSAMQILWPARNIVGDVSTLFGTLQTSPIGLQPTIESLPLPTVTKLRPTAAVKYIGQLQRQPKIGKSKDLFVSMMVDIESDFGDHSLGRFKGEDGNESFVLVEWKCYDNKWTSKSGKELYIRVGELAQLLHHPGKHGLASLRVLDCLGWFHDTQECRFGFVFVIIESPVSLFSLIPQKPQKGVLAPPLGLKFQLASMLAKCLHDIHAIGWLHKNISAHNIIFSPSLGAMTSNVAPYLTGFNHSRTDEEKAFTEGPSNSNRHVEYQHPEYRASGNRTMSRFNRIHDYYSLGLVLLEIALWTPFNRIASRKSTLSPAELRQYIVQNYIPMLGGMVGNGYRDAVTACLTGDFGDRSGEESDEARKDVLVMFQLKVVDPLAACFA